MRRVHGGAADRRGERAGQGRGGACRLGGVWPRSPARVAVPRMTVTGRRASTLSITKDVATPLRG